jgi:DNA-binding response OmpR family regulator
MAAADNAPAILIATGDARERARIAATISDAGFAVVAAAEPCGALAALARHRFAAAVFAPRPDDGGDLLRRARCLQAGLPAVLVLAPAALHLAHEDGATIVKRPFDPRQLLGCLFELVLRDGDDGPGHWRQHSRHAAELGIAAAQLACLSHRRTVAAACGRSWLAQDLTHQIGQVRRTYGDSGLAAG